MNPTTFGNIALGLLLAQTFGIGLSPILFGYNGLYLCSVGSLTYGCYAFLLPGRIIYRLKPDVPVGSAGELCIQDLIRAWALFCIALGAMGFMIVLSGIPQEEGSPESKNDSDDAARLLLLEQQQDNANMIFLIVGLVSIVWDWHVMHARHWKAKNFLMFNMLANIAICTSAVSGLIL